MPPSTVGSAVREVVRLEVTVDPALFVVVMASVMASVVREADEDLDVDFCSDVDASEVEEEEVVCSAEEVGVAAALVGVSDSEADVVDVADSWVEVGVAAAEVTLLAVVGSADVAEDIVVDSWVVDGASLVEVVTPVPTTCRLGIIPAGILSAPICENPKKRENMVKVQVADTLRKQVMPIICREA